MLENVNYKIITKEKYEKILQESDKKTYYLYHYILYKCESNETRTNSTKIYPLTVDEVMYAGGSNWRNLSYYLSDNAGGSNDEQTKMRPAVSLVAGTKISGGNGTIEKPYEIQ